MGGSHYTQGDDQAEVWDEDGILTVASLAPGCPIVGQPTFPYTVEAFSNPTPCFSAAGL
jgi:hypothetical protein